MDKQTFTDVDTPGWWLLHEDPDYKLTEARKGLGDAFGWSDDKWYTNTDYLDQVWQFLESSQSILTALDEVPDNDPDKQVAWVQSLITAKAPAEADAPAAEAPTPAAPDAPVQVAVDAPAAPPPAPAAKKVSIFAKKQSADGGAGDTAATAAPQSEQPAADAASSDAETDGGTSTPAADAPTAEAPKKSIFARKAAPAANASSAAGGEAGGAAAGTAATSETGASGADTTGAATAGGPDAAGGVAAAAEATVAQIEQALREEHGEAFGQLLSDAEKVIEDELGNLFSEA